MPLIIVCLLAGVFIIIIDTCYNWGSSYWFYCDQPFKFKNCFSSTLRTLYVYMSTVSVMS